ncbi:MAG: hypothetical protein EP299_06485 [Acidobacteria bacterium]|nr:MAG: hypothetical protein EP299_06485 [Acidobacteriota bacterium]
MKQQIHRISIVFLAALVIAGAASAASNLWFHVRVNDEDGTKVTVNLPASMIEKAISMIPEEHLGDHGMHFSDHDLTPAQIRELWTELRDSPDMTFVKVEEEGEDVKVWKESGFLYVTVLEEEKNEKVDVRVPFAVVDALLSGNEDELDIQAAINALVQEGEGELVTVTSDDENVRIWVDSIAEAD